MNETLKKFGYPDSVLKSYQHWSVLLRPQQVTLGALILGAHSQAEAFSDLAEIEISELSIIIKHIESTLTHCFKYNKINYLMLMMVDPKVHFHVIPRYAKDCEFHSVTFTDTGWPGPPDLIQATSLDEQQQLNLLNYLRREWVA